VRQSAFCHVSVVGVFVLVSFTYLYNNLLCLLCSVCPSVCLFVCLFVYFSCCSDISPLISVARPPLTYLLIYYSRTFHASCYNHVVTTLIIIHALSQKLTTRLLMFSYRHLFYCGEFGARSFYNNAVSTVRGCQTIDKVVRSCLPMKSATKKSVICHAKIGRFCWPIKSSDVIIQRRTRSILNDEIGQLFW